jgi:hypothetical protein
MRILDNPNSSWEATTQALEVIVERSVANYRAYRGTDLAVAGREGGLSAKNLAWMCGEGRDISSDSIASFTVGSRTPIVVHRMQAADLGIHEAQHSFTVMVMANGRGFIVDPTFAQFADRALPGFRAGSMLSHRRGLEVARNLLRNGFMPLTQANARAYAQGLGAMAGEVNAAATRIMTGDPALLTELIVNGEVHRFTNQPNEVDAHVLPAQGSGDDAGGPIAAINRMLDSDRVPLDDPARPVLAALRDRLMMISARQPQIEATGDLEALSWEPAPETGGAGPAQTADGGQANTGSEGEAGHISPMLMGGQGQITGAEPGTPAPDGGNGPGRQSGPMPDDGPLSPQPPAPENKLEATNWGPPTREVQRQINDPQEAIRLYIEQVRGGNRNARAIRNTQIVNSTWRYTFRQYTEPPLAWLDTNGNIVVDATRVDIAGVVGRGEM